jgi:hypothetical protein
MKNIYLLPTDKPSRLSIDNDINELVYGILSIDNIPNCKNQNIYITNNEEIKEGDWVLMFDDFGNLFLSNEPQKYLGIEKGHHLNKGLRKIILTTDQSLDGVQAIDDDFLEWFVKNPSCESVEIKRIFLGNSFVHIGKTPSKKEKLRGCYDNGEQIVGKWKELFTYEIIIPKQELKQQLDCPYDFTMGKPKQETLEDAAEKYKYNPKGNFCFIEGAKWQQERMYSEEEAGELVYNIIGKYAKQYGIMVDGAELNDLFEQFKKK